MGAAPSRFPGKFPNIWFLIQIFRKNKGFPKLFYLIMRPGTQLIKIFMRVPVWPGRILIRTFAV
jgi:hypothetical protein